MVDFSDAHSKVIICVDDEKVVLNTLYMQISEAFPEYIIEMAESGEEAMELVSALEQEGCTIELIISDQIMPSMKGDELLAKVFNHNQEIISVLLTGQAAVESTISAINNSNLFRYLTKPWEANDLVLCISKALKQRDLTRKIKMQMTAFKKFVPTEFLTTLNLSYDDPASLKPGVFKVVENTILFLDLRDFTSISESISTESLTNKLVHLFSEFEKNIRDNKGFVDKYLGDAIMAIFPDPNDAIRSALRLIQSLEFFNSEEQIGWSMGIGINTGESRMLIIGSNNRVDSTIIGDTVNIASRLESITKDYAKRIIISDNTFQTLSEAHQALFEKIGEVSVKGKQNDLLIYGYGEADQ